MGEQRVSMLKGDKEMQQFVRYLLRDVEALEYMLENDWFEKDVTRIGAEQEMVLVDRTSFKPAPVNMEALETMEEFDWVEPELAKFNLEINLSPREFKGSCITEMKREALDRLDIIQEHLRPLHATPLLIGILPTLRKFDLEMHNLTPLKRYKALMKAIDEQLLGESYELRINGIDELLLKHDSPMLEACNTSFQVHLQVRPDEFVRMYNISQALAAPVMAIAANSPIVFGRRLWHETRIALFQQSLDTRATHEHMRERSPRVQFGRGWLRNSILDIYREDIARFRVLLSADVQGNALELVESGEVPKLGALQVHNSTIYRWNRPCYGISANGKPHLRIENRVLPSGPTVADEMANAALWLGCMIEMGDAFTDITEHISWADVQDNFGKAARYGIDSKFTWLDDEKITAVRLVRDKLIPNARKGLEKRDIDPEDIDYYLGIIEERAERHMNGARWGLRAFTSLLEQTTRDEAMTVLTASVVKNQEKELPIHKWKLPKLEDLEEYRPSNITVEEFMDTDLFTVREEDIIELVAEMLDWRKIRYMPVEDNKGKLIGLVTSRLILRHFLRMRKLKSDESATVGDIMIEDPITVKPDMSILEAMRIMQKQQIGCLPVVHKGELVGIVTEPEFLRIASRLIDRLEN